VIRIAVLAVAIAGAALPAAAEPYRLRGSVFTTAEPPVGLMILEAESDEIPGLAAEALVWGELDTADVLVVAVTWKDRANRYRLRAGRLVVSGGAIRPVHIDGAVAEARAPWGTRVELFSGLPVQPAFGARDYDWLVGTRLSHQISKRAVAGISYLHERDNGAIADHEIGIDGGFRATRWLDVAGKAAFDLVFPGISDLHVSAAATRRGWRYELYGARRSPSRLLPATSLFAALGDMPSTEGGTAVKWRAAPRLDLLGTAAIRLIDDDAGEDLSARAILRTDEQGRGALGLELRRQGGPSGWTGLRGTARIPLAPRWAAAAEAELAAPDDSGGRGSLWPWGLVALQWRPATRWLAAAAIEADASAEHSGRLTGMMRLSHQWGAP
jgi:hypothetical protein